jgi:ribosomal protein S18 acetylase RimI-like enzyme
LAPPEYYTYHPILAGGQEVHLDVVQTNEPAISLYRSMGYVTINEEVMLGLYL